MFEALAAPRKTMDPMHERSGSIVKQRFYLRRYPESRGLANVCLRGARWFVPNGCLFAVLLGFKGLKK